MKKCTLTFLFLFSIFLLPANNSKDKIDKQLDQSFELLQSNVDSAILLAKASLELSKQSNYEYGIANSYVRISLGYRFKGLFEDAITCADTAINLSRLNPEFRKILASAYNNKGVCLKYTGETDKALDNYLKAIDIYSEQNDTSQKATVLNSVGVMLMDSDFPKKAMDYFDQAIALQQLMGNKKGVADVYNNYAILYANSGDLKKSLEYFQKSFSIEESLGNKRGMVESYGNIGLVYFMQGKLEEAIKITLESIEIERELGNLRGEIASYNTIAEMYNEVNRTEEAIAYLNKSLITAKEINSYEDIATAYENLAASYALQGKFEKALDSYIQSYEIKDSVKGINQQKVIAEMEAKFNTKEKQKTIEIQELNLQQKEVKLKAKQTENFALIFSIIALSVIGFLFYFNFKNKKQKELSQAVIKEQEKGIQAVFTAQEVERRRISEDLHDGVGQQLSGLKMAFQKIAKGIENENHERSGELKELSSILSESADEVRSISHQMMPKALTELGLIEALEDMLKKSFTYSDMKYEFDHYGIESRLNENVEISLYRIAQELVNNVIKHSDANSINVQLFKNQQKVILIVEDDGKGMPSDKIYGHGILNIKSRVSSLGGESNIEAGPNRGTIVTIRVPIPETNA